MTKTATPPDPKLKQEEEEILKEICVQNGLSLSQLVQQSQSCLHLEMFFSGMPRILGLSNFPNLQVLCVMGQQLKKIEGLSSCPKLKELWLCELQLKKIEGLDSLKHLRRLYLYDNKITKIENIGHLIDLEVLWLNINEITEIEGLTSLKHLKELNLAQNEISKIGNTLGGLAHLEKLEISGNKFYSFKELTTLQKLPHLRELGIKSPGYPLNPVGLLCNYSTHVLFHMPTLERLDGLNFSNSSVKELAENTVLKKKMFYNMRSKTLWRNCSEIEGKLREVKRYILQPPHERIRNLSFSMKQLQFELQELESPREGGESGTESEKDARDDKAAEIHARIMKIKTKIAAIQERIAKWERRNTEVEAYYADGLERLRAVTELQVQRLVTELDTGGNVRFEDGNPDTIWFTTCHDLVLSRFCAADYRECGIVGVKIHRVTRVHNRMLRMKFDEALSKELDDTENYYPPTKNTSYKTLLEYLFWIQNPELPGGASEPQRVLEDGFTDAATYKQFGKEAAVPLTNSISLAERFRIKHAVKQAKNKEYRDTCPYRHGQLVITKVYIGKSTQASENKTIEKSKYPKADTVFKPRQDGDEKNLLATDDKLEKASNVMSMGDLVGPAKQQCECTSRQAEWFVFNHHLAVPEYIVDFEYVTRLAPMSPFLSEEEGVRASKDPSGLAGSDMLPPDDDVLTMEPAYPPVVPIADLTTESLTRHVGVSTAVQITTLTLHGCGLPRLRGLSALTNLQRLNVCFNALTRLDDVAHMGLEYLDAGFNKINTLEGLKNMSKLKYLDLTWNNLQNTREDVSILRKHCPILNTLDLRHNHWQKSEGLRLRAIGRIKSLTNLNGSLVLEHESAAALRMAAGSRISQVSLLSHARTDTTPPRSLSLASSAQILAMHSRNRPDRAADQDNMWLARVTALTLDSQHISKISNVERLENLRYASFNDNDITKIEGLDSCVNLEELSLEHNCITRIEGLTKLTNLRRLCLGHNYISSLDNCGLDKLANLQYLSVESNRLKSLLGLQRNHSIVELYVGNNRLDNLRELFVLKSLPSLLILDLFGNPLVQSADNYRLFVIYHLKALKALDGSEIETAESSQAKDTFGGRLTQDFVAEKLNHSNFSDVKEMDFPQCSIRSVDLGNGDLFLNLRSINLENNNLTSFSGLIYLVNLRVLCLNHNHIECIVPRSKNQTTASKGPRSVYSSNSAPASVFAPDVHTPLLESLEVLHLGYNGIKDMAQLQLSRLTSLKALFLQGNEIQQIAGIEGLQDLRELVLDRNKIKNIGEYSIINQWNLVELHLEENRLKELTNIGCLQNLQRLFLGTNRIQEMSELEKLEPLTCLVELSVVSNAVARRMLHRPLLVFRMPGLHVIDGIPVSEEERAKAEMCYTEQQDTTPSEIKWLEQNFPSLVLDKPKPQQVQTTIEATLPGLGNYKTQIPVKVTNMNMQLSGPYTGHNWTSTLHLQEDTLQGRRVSNIADKRNEQPSAASFSNGTTGSKMTATMTYQHGGSRREQGGGNTAQTRQYGTVPFVPHHDPGKLGKR